MTSPTLSFDEVQKRFARRKVLDGVSFVVQPGECFGLVGVNGAGKTTCIKSLLDFADINGGRIEIFGVDASETHARQALAFLPERFAPPHYLTGRDFLRYMGELHQLSNPLAAVDSLADALDFDQEALARPVSQYSKGMAQKLGLMACFAANKRLLVLDEPMSGLDPKARLLVKRHLSNVRAAGTSLFFSTHLLTDVSELCDRMGILHEGRMQFVGSPEECVRRFGQDNLEEAYLQCISGASAQRGQL